jgi:hypothetical protein
MFNLLMYYIILHVCYHKMPSVSFLPSILPSFHFSPSFLFSVSCVLSILPSDWNIRECYVMWGRAVAFSKQGSNNLKVKDMWNEIEADLYWIKLIGWYKLWWSALVKKSHLNVYYDYMIFISILLCSSCSDILDLWFSFQTVELLHWYICVL